jgi:hypothetical protein
MGAVTSSAFIIAVPLTVEKSNQSMVDMQEILVD